YRGERIWTSELVVPKHALYQAKLRPELRSDSLSWIASSRIPNFGYIGMKTGNESIRVHHFNDFGCRCIDNACTGGCAAFSRSLSRARAARTDACAATQRSRVARVKAA